MRPFVTSLVLLVVVAVLGGCANLARTPVQPPPGFLFQETQAPLSINYDHTQVKPTKVGTSSTRFISLWPILSPMVSIGLDDASMEAAANNGGIKEVAYADYKIYNILGVYSVFTVTAYGE